MSTKLRILIDESVPDDVADYVLSLSAVNAVYVTNVPSLRGRKDPEIFKAAQSDERILLTRDDGFNKHKHPICKHRGIIRIKTQSTHESVFIEAIRCFIHSGHRSSAKHAITDLHEKGCIIEGSGGLECYHF